jgi:hypothetical protein
LNLGVEKGLSPTRPLYWVKPRYIDEVRKICTEVTKTLSRQEIVMQRLHNKGQVIKNYIRGSDGPKGVKMWVKMLIFSDNAPETPQMNEFIFPQR